LLDAARGACLADLDDAVATDTEIARDWKASIIASATRASSS
jgi:hypothetical protein